MVRASQVTVTNAATALVSTTDISGQSVLVRNRGSASVFLGGSGVTTAAGFQLDAAEACSFDLASDETLYAIAASGTVRVDVLVTQLG